MIVDHYPVQNAVVIHALRATLFGGSQAEAGGIEEDCGSDVAGPGEQPSFNQRTTRVFMKGLGGVDPGGNS